MATEERPHERVPRKLTKKQKESRRISLDIPDRFKDGEDAHEDVTAPTRKDTMSMNQSLFSMIARAGQQSQTDLRTMQEVDSGESDDEGKRRIPYHSLDGAARLSRISTVNDFQHPPEELDGSRPSGSKHKRALSDHKLLRSLPKLKMSSRKESKTDAQPTDRMSSSQFLPPRPSEDESTSTSQDERPSRPISKGMF
jgi:sterol 3beta-glucosyltransferase